MGCIKKAWLMKTNVPGTYSIESPWFARIEAIRAIVRKTNSAGRRLQNPKCGVEA
jgi:hypothetical protein